MIPLPLSRSIRLTLGVASLLVLPILSARAELIYVTNGTNITRVDSTSLATTTTVTVTGMQGGETLTGIDVRAADGLLYGVGSTSRLYRLDPITGVATLVGQGAYTLNGTSFGFDFNPQADRLRVVSDNEQNLRILPTDGSLVLADTALSPVGNIVGAAYDRNDNNAATLTTLFAIDSAAGTLARIGDVDGTPNTPNTGLVTTIGSLGLGTSLNANIGFDISGLSATAFASITTSGISRLYTINLTTGASTLVGTIGTGTTPYSGLAAATAPEPATVGLLLAGLGSLCGLRRRRSVS